MNEYTCFCPVRVTAALYENIQSFKVETKGVAERHPHDPGPGPGPDRAVSRTDSVTVTPVFPHNPYYTAALDMIASTSGIDILYVFTVSEHAVKMLALPSNVILLMFLYFIQGLPYGFQARFLPILLREQGVSLTNLGFFKLLLVPWLCKALWAPLVDKYGTKRKWLLGSVLGLVVTCLLGCLVQQHQLLVLCVVLFLLNLFAATQDIAVDGLAIAILSEEELGQGNTAQVVGYKIGSIFGGGVLLWSLDWVGWTGMFLMLAALYIEAFMFVFVSPSIRYLEKKTAGPGTFEVDDDSLSEGQFDDAEDDEVFVDGNINAQTSQLGVEANTDISSPQGTLHEKTAVHNSHCSNGNESMKDGEQSHRPESASGWHFRKLFWGCKPMEKLSFVSDVLAVPGTRWMMLYISIYKLGNHSNGLAISVLSNHILRPVFFITWFTKLSGRTQKIRKIKKITSFPLPLTMKLLD